MMASTIALSGPPPLVNHGGCGWMRRPDSADTIVGATGNYSSTRAPVGASAVVVVGSIGICWFSHTCTLFYGNILI